MAPKETGQFDTAQDETTILPEAEMPPIDEPDTGEIPLTTIKPGWEDEVEEEDAEAAAALRNLEESRRKKRRNRIIRVVATLVILGIIAGALVFNFAGKSASNAAGVPNIGVAERRSYSTTIQGSGSLRPASSVVVTPEIDGIIDTVYVSEGQEVKQGDTLFTIKNDALDKAVDDAQRSLTTAQKSLDDAYKSRDSIYQTREDDRVKYENARAQAEVDQQNAQAAFDRKYNEVVSGYDNAVTQTYADYQLAEQTYQNAIAAGADESELTQLELKRDEKELAYNEAKTNRQNAEVDAQNIAMQERATVPITPVPNFDENSYNTQIEAADKSIDTAQASVDTAQAALDKANADAAKRTVKSPANGTLLTLNAKKGASVGGAAGATANSGSGPLAEISDLTQMRVTVNVNEIDISTVKEGQSADITFSALPDLKLYGEVVSIASVAGSNASSAGAGSSSGSGVVSYPVEIVIKKPDDRLKPGMTASVTVVTEEVADALVVPAMAVETEGTRTYVTVVTDNGDGTYKYDKREVTVAQHNSKDAVITDGVKANEQVLISDGLDSVDSTGGKG